MVEQGEKQEKASQKPSGKESQKGRKHSDAKCCLQARCAKGQKGKIGQFSFGNKMTLVI